LSYYDPNVTVVGSTNAASAHAPYHITSLRRTIFYAHFFEFLATICIATCMELHQTLKSCCPPKQC